MKLFLQIEIGHWQKGAYSNFLSYASSLSSDVVGTDLDSQSEPMIADLVVKLMDKSSAIFLFVQARDANSSLGTAQPVFNYLSGLRAKISKIVLCGDHRTAEQVFRNGDVPFVKECDEEKIKSLIAIFAQDDAKGES